VLVALLFFGAGGVGIVFYPFFAWAAGCAVVAVAIVATRGAPWTRLASSGLALVSAVASSYFLLGSSEMFTFTFAATLSVSIVIALLGGRSWASGKGSA
jgi:hypothetical protein